MAYETIPNVHNTGGLCQFGKEMDTLRMVVLVVIFWNVILYLPLYGYLSTVSTDLLLTYRYAWAVSSMFLEGPIAGGILFTMIFLFAALIPLSVSLLVDEDIRIILLKAFQKDSRISSSIENCT